VAAIVAIEQTQIGLPNVPGQPGRCPQSTRRILIAQPPEPHGSAWCPHENGEQCGILSCSVQALPGGRIRRETTKPPGIPAASSSPNGPTRGSGTYFQRCPASTTRAELASMDTTTRTRKA
jgi:hypothetical protein